MKLLDQAWSTVSEKSIQNCFMKVGFACSTSEENHQNGSESDNIYKGIWKRLQASGLVPEGFSFNEYIEGDANLITRETVTESTIINDLTASENPTADQEDDSDEETSQDEHEPTPFSALQALSTIDCYFRAQENSGCAICPKCSRRYWQEKPLKRNKPKSQISLRLNMFGYVLYNEF